MPSGLLPLFPLETVLLPRAPLPLHIFEDRYREMVGEAIRDHTEFGIVLARNRTLAETGCTAVVVKVIERYPDGRLDILTAGQRRFEIQRVDSERSYLRAEVSFFDDDDREPDDAELLAELRKHYEEFCGLVGRKTVDVEPGESHTSFLFAQAVTDLDLLQELLGLRSECERQRKLVSYWNVFLANARTHNQARQLAARNGHGARRAQP